MKALFSIFAIFGLLAGLNAHAIFGPDTASQTLLSRSNSYDPLPGLGNVINHTKNMIRYTYDFSVLGSSGAGSIFLLDDQGLYTTLPKGAIVTNVVANIITQPLPSTSSIALGLVGATGTDLMATKVQSSLSIGFLAGVPVGTAATWVGPVVAGFATSPVVGPPSVDGALPFMTLTGSTLTAGKIEWFVEYVIQ